MAAFLAIIIIKLKNRKTFCMSTPITYVEGGDANGSHRSEDSEDSQSGQVDWHQLLLVAVGQTPAQHTQYSHTHTHTQ